MYNRPCVSAARQWYLSQAGHFRTTIYLVLSTAYTKCINLNQYNLIKQLKIERILQKCVIQVS